MFLAGVDDTRGGADAAPHAESPHVHARIGDYASAQGRHLVPGAQLPGYDGAPAAPTSTTPVAAAAAAPRGRQYRQKPQV